MKQIYSLFFKKIIGLVLLAFLFSSVNAVFAQPFKLEPIENPAGFFTPQAINNSGQIAGDLYSTKDFKTHGQRREADGQYTDLAELDNSGSVVNDINEYGHIPGYRLDALGFGYPGVWVGDTFRDLEIPADAQFTPYALSINNSSVVAGDYIDTLSQIHVVVWDSSGKVTRLPESDATSSFAAAINDSGDITGTLVKPDGTFMAALWQRENGTYNLVELGTLGGPHSQSMDINNRGQIVGFANYGSDPNLVHGFLWQNGEMLEMGTLGGENSRALAINDVGIICGTAQIETTIQTNSMQNNIFEELYNKHLIRDPINKPPDELNKAKIDETYRGFKANWDFDQQHFNIINIAENSNAMASESYALNLQQHQLIYSLEMSHYYLAIPQYLAFFTALGSVMPELGSPFSPFRYIADAQEAMTDTWNPVDGLRQVYKFESRTFAEDVNLNEGYYGFGSWNSQTGPDFQIGTPLNIGFDGNFVVGSDASLTTFSDNIFEYHFSSDFRIDGEFTYNRNKLFFHAESGQENSIILGPEAGLMGDGPITFNGLGNFMVTIDGSRVGTTDVTKHGDGKASVDLGNIKIRNLYHRDGIIHLRNNLTIEPNGMVDFLGGIFTSENGERLIIQNPAKNAVTGVSGHVKYMWLDRALQFNQEPTYYDFWTGGEERSFFSINLKQTLDIPIDVGVRYLDWGPTKVEITPTPVYLENMAQWATLDVTGKDAWNVNVGGSFLQSPSIKVQPSKANNIVLYNCLHIVKFDSNFNYVGLAGGDISIDDNLFVDGKPIIIEKEVPLEGNCYYVVATNNFINRINLPPQDFARLQIINIITDHDSVDSYLNGTNINWNLKFQEATPFGSALGVENTLDFVDSQDADNSNPIATSIKNLSVNENYIFIPRGSGENIDILYKQGVSLASSDSEKVEITAVNTVPEIGSIEVKITIDGQETVLSTGLGDGEFTESKNVTPGIAEILILGTVYKLDLSMKKGESLLVMITKNGGSPKASNSQNNHFTVIAVDVFGNIINSENVTSTQEKPTLGLPTEYNLAQNYPNPFNPTTQINYQLPLKAHVNLVIYDQLGQLVRQLVNREQAAGSYSIQWDGLNESGNAVSSGIYLYRVEVTISNASTFADTKKMVLLK